jgi:hypothetical protein
MGGNNELDVLPVHTSSSSNSSDHEIRPINDLFLRYDCIREVVYLTLVKSSIVKVLFWVSKCLSPSQHDSTVPAILC